MDKVLCKEKMGVRSTGTESNVIAKNLGLMCFVAAYPHSKRTPIKIHGVKRCHFLMRIYNQQNTII